ncbi:AAA family ATPase [Microbacterium wangchenii]|uniref:AAA family ATPase n=1 Tax=Microbacterium wangchenii TaxID=2541726 RepID=UPI0021C2DD1E|nr:AAA family ATPase [Microbacterium wangchenii]
MAYAFEGTCDSHLSGGASAASGYAETDGRTVTRFALDEGGLVEDELTADALSAWVDGRDPATGEQRGRVLATPEADLVLDGTINAPKSFSIAALLHPELAAEYERLQDGLRDRVIRAWHTELNARRGAGGRIRERLARIEVVELQHRRSRALDPHVHRHLWLNVKVRGRDGRWSNVDSRVAMRFHTVVNAEGEIAARTDPAWVAALARHGYTLGADGEILQLQHLVKPMSRRSNQIEANRAMLLAEWRAEHAGAEPSLDARRSIDRRAWALGRPNKPHHLEEEDWERLTREEIGEIDPRALSPHGPVLAPATRVEKADVELLALRAVADADARSPASGGRISVFDLRAGALRAVAASGVVGDRDSLQSLIDEVEAAAHLHTEDLLPEAGERPAHVKALMAQSTADLKREVAERLEALSTAGQRPSTSVMALVAKRALGPGPQLGNRQLDAATAIAGTDRLVSVTGPAGSGKTSMLRVAQFALAAQNRRMMVVAPTKKAASVASRETGAAASSLHALLFDHGWRWRNDDAGRQVWTRLAVGDVDRETGSIYRGSRLHPLRLGDRVVVDEAGMVDLECANALLALAAETGAGIAMVGDHLQAAPVGHAGAMAALTRRATSFVELDSVHRFRDPEYGQLTLRLRNASTKEDAFAVARDLDDGRHLRRADDKDAARAAMLDGYFARTALGQRVALVAGTNEEADALNESIQQRRIANGELNPARWVLGAQDQRILVGEIVQTRRNDRAAGVENRALWRVADASRKSAQLVSLSDPRDSRTITLDYAGDHLQLAYASTVHGIQGETTDAAIVGPDVDAAGLYVGMTRGRLHNEAVVIASTQAAARARLAEAMRRGLPEVAVADSVRAARDDMKRAAQDPSADGPLTSGEQEREGRVERLLLRLQADAATQHARGHASGDDARVHSRVLDRIRSALENRPPRRSQESTRSDASRVRLGGDGGVPEQTSRRPAL